MYIIAGLGNPGTQYRGTRHNCGFCALDALGQRHNMGYNDDKFKAMFGKGRIEGQSVVLVKPLTYMNLSGEAIKGFVDYFKIDVPTELIVLYDDIYLPPGQLRVRPSGSPGGHNGIKNITKMLGTQDFARVRIGVGEKPKDWDLADYVLSRFSDEEEEKMQAAYVRAAEAVECILTEGIETAMNRFNVKTE